MKKNFFFNYNIAKGWDTNHESVPNEEDLNENRASKQSN